MVLRAKIAGVEFGLATIGDAADMVDFHNAHYGDKRKPAHWLWEYNQFDPEKAVFAYAKDHGRVIATQAMIPIYLSIGGKQVLSGKSENTLLLPQYRGSGLMQSLYEYAVEQCIERGMQLIWGFTEATKAFERFGFVCCPNIKLLVKPGRFQAYLVSKLGSRVPFYRKLGAIGRQIFRTVLSARRKPVSAPLKTGYKLSKGDWCDEQQLRGLYERLNGKCDDVISLALSTNYLKWRMREHPFIEYKEYQVHLNGELTAYAFVALHEQALSISDLTAEDSYSTAVILSSVISDYSDKAGHYRFLVNPKEPFSQNVLGSLTYFGFSAGGDFNLVVRDLSGGKNQQIWDINNWHINGLWTEGYSM